jgi:antitoxin MazE
LILLSVVLIASQPFSDPANGSLRYVTNLDIFVDIWRRVMKMQVGRWGNSLAVRLPKILAERYDLAEGDEFDSRPMEEALDAIRDDVLKARRKQALREIAETNWTLPADWKFDREDANAR